MAVAMGKVRTNFIATGWLLETLTPGKNNQSDSFRMKVEVGMLKIVVARVQNCTPPLHH